ncbi:acetyltransferase [Halopseudomonas oceani]|uniref:GNAT family N-acetyltransferase n=1 Tax=Halopseudomonas oceani TaxID=1708783 RepID=A0A2P4EZD1_9GAMM|nr:GNAT family N-acetyltransferase [Halopseudomonas oceani]POB05815.1 GNAT family N-acetyltransferase [Halopseudomonas oceani]GGE42504.1 acetyltransferase [Halopseudomonas oceani]
MIRAASQDDTKQLADIWLAASIKAHDFVEPAFWQARLEDMRTLYIPASECFLEEHQGRASGFCCLVDDCLAALFVAPDRQGQGIGSRLLDEAKRRRKSLQLTVYKANHASVGFYQKQGFRVTAEQVDEHTGHAELCMRYDTQGE